MIYFTFNIVAPLVGAWIEITACWMNYHNALVAPLVGAWIEIVELAMLLYNIMSLPSWERGLKYKS